MVIKDKIRDIFSTGIKIKTEFISEENNVASMSYAAEAMIETYKKGGKILIFGNGGSAADSQHMAAELLVRFEKDRKPLAAIALTTDTSILTATSNDFDFKDVFSRQIEGLGRKEDLAVAISTSGMSENVVTGIKKAKERGMRTVAITGRDGGALLKEADIAICVRSDNTARIQEVHNVIVHVLCKIVEDAVS